MDDLLYVVVEEEIDGVIGLVVAEWPGSDAHGAPHFRRGGKELEIAVARRDLQDHLGDRQVPEWRAGDGDEIGPSDEAKAAMRRRTIAVGDVFAVRPERPLPSEEEAEAGIQSCDWMGETIDVTPDAREAAKAKMYEALTPRLDPAIAEELLAKRNEASQGPELMGR